MTSEESLCEALRPPKNKRYSDLFLSKLIGKPESLFPCKFLNLYNPALSASKTHNTQTFQNTDNF